MKGYYKVQCTNSNFSRLDFLLNYYYIIIGKGGYMHLVEIRQDLQDTSLKTSIYENSKIIRQLETLAEFTTDLSQADCEYIATLLLKSKT